MPDLKVVVLTNHGSLYGKKILNHFRAREIPVRAAVIIRQPLTYFLKLFRFIHRRVGVFDSIYFALRRLSLERQSNQITRWRGCPFIAHYDQLGIPAHHSRQTNSPQTQQLLASLAPDLMILGQTGIVREDVLKIPRVGALNAHPGILPHYRGIDCAKWAVHRGDFQNVGSSVHWVDRGVDTGNLIVTQPYTFSGVESLDTLDDHLYDQCALLLGDVVEALRRGEAMLGAPQNRQQGRQYYKMSLKDEAVARDKLRAFLQRMK
ncbi:MAG: hypothetical protein HY868_26120 [Chloroflexi bacterium]|nr:hypothetical protein [Chloroflexota bacterium]